MLPHALLNRTNNNDKKLLVILNDDKTPLEYVVQILYYSFGLSWKKALLLAVEIHENDSGVIGEFDDDSGRKIIDIIHLNARNNGYPLQLEQKNV